VYFCAVGYGELQPQIRLCLVFAGQAQANTQVTGEFYIAAQAVAGNRLAHYRHHPSGQIIVRRGNEKERFMFSRLSRDIGELILSKL